MDEQVRLEYRIDEQWKVGANYTFLWLGKNDIEQTTPISGRRVVAGDYDAYAKDIQFCSKQRFNAEHVRVLGKLRAAMNRVLAELPPELQNDPDVQLIAPHCDAREWTLAFNFRCANGCWRRCIGCAF